METEKQKAFAKFWNEIPERRRKVLVERAYMAFRNVRNKQIEILRELKRSKNFTKNGRFTYFFVVVESFWRDADFALALGKKNHSHYATYPVRTMMEKLLKILWFTKQTPEIQDTIIKKELLYGCYLFHKMEQEAGRTGEEFEKRYGEINHHFNGEVLPPINSVKADVFKIFESYKILCQKSGLIDATTLYNSYRHLSGLPHGDILSIFRIGDEEREEYRRVMMLAVRFSIEMLKITDLQIVRATKNEVASAIERADKITSGLA